MIIFGTGRKALGKTQAVTDVACDTCRHPALFGTVVQQYVHIFWIPALPTQKSVVFRCANCQRTTQPVGQTPLWQAATRMLAATRTPLWYYAFAMLMGASVLVAFIAAPKHARSTEPPPRAASVSKH
jgi:hypothetical protein